MHDHRLKKSGPNYGQCISLNFVGCSLKPTDAKGLKKQQK